MKKSFLHFIKPKIRQQIIFICMLSTFIPLFIVGIFSILQARKQMSEQYEAQITADAVRINSTIFDITTSLYTSTDALLKNRYFNRLFGIDSFGPQDIQDYELVTNSLSSMRSTTAAIASIIIYTDNPNIPASSNIILVEDNYVSQPWSDMVQTKKVSNWQCLTGMDSGKSTVYELSLIRRISVNSTKYSAYLELRIDPSYLKNRLYSSDYLVMASVDNGLTFYSSDRSWVQKLIPFPSDFMNNYYKYTGPLVINGKKQLTKFMTFLPYLTNNKFYICVSDPEAYDNLNHITRIYYIILIIATIIPILLTILFSSYFSTRIQTLKNAMHKVSMGDYNILKMLKGDDELTEIFQDLNATVEKIYEKEARFYRSQIKEQQLINKQQHMEFKMLASQINPHFLYNTLEMIRMQALASGSMDVVSSIKLLAKSMRYVLENTGTDSTTLMKELEYIEAYLSIQKLRFGDRINYDIQYPENLDTERYKILPLLLQPVIENAVIHGLERPNIIGQISVKILPTNNDKLVIEITDNGQGMTQEKLKEINERINSVSLDSSTSIGLYNINQRIKLLYGTEYGITFASQQSQGTMVTLTIPAIVNKEV